MMRWLWGFVPVYEQHDCPVCGGPGGETRKWLWCSYTLMCKACARPAR